jgi:hypothetical protein
MKRSSASSLLVGVASAVVACAGPTVIGDINNGGTPTYLCKASNAPSTDRCEQIAPLGADAYTHIGTTRMPTPIFPCNPRRLLIGGKEQINGKVQPPGSVVVDCMPPDNGGFTPTTEDGGAR